MNIWVKDLSRPFENALPITDSKRPLMVYAWTEDGAFVLHVKDKDSDENMNLYAVDSMEAKQGCISDSRNLTPYG
jgi:hypothetical protein